MQNINNVGKICCSFCGKKQSEVNKIIAGDNVFICDECVILCYDIIKNEKGVEERNTKISELDPEKIYNYLDQYVVGQI
jgi:ATP-dependent Clp protease ATP-binding subunit ClpX